MPETTQILAPVDTIDPNKGLEPVAVWDDQFAQPYELKSFAVELAAIADEEEEVIPPPAPASVAVSSTPEPEDAPEVHKFDDGSSVTVEKTNKGWKATLDNNDGSGNEVFYGKNKNELLVNSLAAKARATKKIRSQEKEIKRYRLQNVVEPAVAPTDPAPQPITADDVFAIKTKMESNPVEAVRELIKKETGMSLTELAALAKEGREAKRALTSEEVARDFMAQNPDYYPDQGYENYQSILTYLVNKKLHKAMPSTDEAIKAVASEIHARGFWTVSNLQEAFDYLKQEGLLVMAPSDAPEEPEQVVEKPAVVAAPVVQTPASPPAPARIVRTGPRAGLGIRSSVASATPPEPTKPPSVEELKTQLENASDNEIEAAWNAVRQYARRNK